MTPRNAVLALVGGAVGLLVLERLTKHKDPGKAIPIFVPDDSVSQTSPISSAAFKAVPGFSTPPSPQVSSQAPILVQDSPIPIVPGKAYRVTLVTHRAANAASENQVRGEAEKRGFTNVVAMKQKPAGWPGATNGDWYVSAIYTGGPRMQARSEGNILGSVDVVEVWQG